MPIDTSIYQNIKPIEMPSMMDHQQKAMNLSSLAMQRMHTAQQMERESKEAAYLDQTRKFSVLGGAVEALAGMPEEERATAYKSVRDRVMATGLFQPEDLPEQYDSGLFRTTASSVLPAYQKSKEYLDRQLTQSEIAKNLADAKRKESDPNLFLRLQNFELTRQKELDSNVGKLQDNLGNSQDAVRSIKDVENTLGFQLEDYDPSKDDLPGVSIPGYGRVTAHSSDARNLNSSLAKIFNTVLRDRSGAAVTTPELERLREEFNTGKYNTEEELISAAKRYKSALMAKMQDIEAGSNPQALAEYKNRRGTTSTTLAYREGERKKTVKSGGGAGTTSAYAGSPPQMPDFDNMSAADLDKYLSGGR